MTESEWLVSENSVAMLDYLTRNDLGTELREVPLISDRQSRLIAVACCRRIWNLLTDERSRQALEVAEEFADGNATSDEMFEADRLAEKAWEDAPAAGHWAAQAVWWATTQVEPDYDDYEGFVKSTIGSVNKVGVSDKFNADLIRCIVGNPFRPVVLPPGPECRTCGGSGDVAAFNAEGWDGCPHCAPSPFTRGTGHAPCPWLTDMVLDLAQAAYDERDSDGFLEQDRLSVLSDAMEEAGCDDVYLLQPLRGFDPCPLCFVEGAHGNEEGCGGRDYGKWPRGFHGWVKADLRVAGFWVLDLLLSKELLVR